MVKYVDCARCGGKGEIKEHDPGFGITYQMVTCPACHGAGKQRVP